MPVRAVLFDLGDTLIFQARQPNEQELYDRMATQTEPLLRSWGVEQPLALATLLRDLHRAVDTAQPQRRALAYEVDGPFITRGAFSASGIEVSSDQAQAFWDSTFLGFSARGVQQYPDTTDTLRRLRLLDVPIAIVSNGKYRSEVWRPYLPEVGVAEDLVAAIVSSPDLMRPKPHPALFLRAIEALAVEPADAVFVGDDLEADVRGAKALAMTTVWKLNGRHDRPPAPEADHVIHDLWEIFTLGLLPETASARPRQESPTPHDDNNAGRY